MNSTPTACPKCGRLVDFCDHREIVATQLAEPVAVCADVDCSVEHPTGNPRQPSAEQDALTYGVGFTRVAPADVFRQPDTPTACPDCNNCGLPCLNEIHHPRQPSLTSSAVKTLDRLLDMPADELKAKIDAHEETGLGELVLSATHPEPRQPDASEALRTQVIVKLTMLIMSALDTDKERAANIWAEGLAPVLQTDFHREKHRESFKVGANWGHARALKEMGAVLNSAEEVLCAVEEERNSLREQLAAAQSEVERLKNIIKLYEIQLSAGGFV